MNKEELEKINTEINKLYSQRESLLKEEKQKNEENIKKLDWLKECDGTLYYDTIWSVGLPKYRIVLYGKCPDYTEMIQVYGNRKDYYYNNIFYNSKGYSYININPTLSTQSDETLIEFLKTYKLKSLKYDESYLKLLSTAKEIYNKINLPDILKWWEEASTIEREDFLREIKSDCVSPTVWYVYPVKEN